MPAALRSIIRSTDAIGSGTKYLAVFNASAERLTQIRADWSALRMPVMRDLWERKDLGAVDGGCTSSVAPDASGLYRLMHPK